MPAFVVEIETPTGRKVRKGTIAATEQDAVNGIKLLQMSYSQSGIPKCQRGEIVDVWLREPGRPLPKGVLANPEAVKILSQFPLK